MLDAVLLTAPKPTSCSSVFHCWAVWVLDTEADKRVRHPTLLPVCSL